MDYRTVTFMDITPYYKYIALHKTVVFTQTFS